MHSRPDFVAAVGSQELKQRQADDSDICNTLGAYSFGHKTSSRESDLRMTSSNVLEQGGQLLDYLLSDPPSPLSNSVGDPWATDTSSRGLLTDLKLLSNVEPQCDMSADPAPDWSDFLMPLLSACDTDGSSSSMVTSSSFSGSASSSLSSSSASTTATSPRVLSSSFLEDDPIYRKTSSTSILSGGRTSSVLKAECEKPATTQSIETAAKLEDQSSLVDINRPLTNCLASWLDQDVFSGTSNDHVGHDQRLTQQRQGQPTYSNSSSRQAIRTSAASLPLPSTHPSYSARPRSSSSGYTLVPLVDPQGLLWAAVMMNGLNQAQARGVELASPLSDASTFMDDSCQGQEALDRDREIANTAGSPLTANESCTMLPGLGPNEPTTVELAQTAGLETTSPWPYPLPTSMSDLQQHLLRRQSMLGITPIPEQNRTIIRGSFASSSGSNDSQRKQKEDAVRISAVRSRRQTFVNQQQGCNRRESGASDENCEKEMMPPLSDRVTKATLRSAPSRTSSFSKAAPGGDFGPAALTCSSHSHPEALQPQDIGNCGSSSSSIGFTITDNIVLGPRPGSGDDEVPYPCITPSYPPPSNNPGPVIDAAHRAAEAVEQVSNPFASDLYAPRFTRRGKCGREGWCSLCPVGDWYSMKRSQYLYHMQFDHGISNLTRRLLHPPQQLRVWNDAVSKTDGLCHHCKKWVPICFGPQRKRDWKAWFKHARKCHRDDSGCPI